MGDGSSPAHASTERAPLDPDEAEITAAPRAPQRKWFGGRGGLPGAKAEVQMSLWKIPSNTESCSWQNLDRLKMPRMFHYEGIHCTDTSAPERGERHASRRRIGQTQRKVSTA
ncbi:hypothetical protein JZ751_016647 [Albula glossodonta]|uniref:Uncharacterized protein n=1 Tax=Albula glossodonta TaxID=121402 RepID=A0A8T2N5S5_9TELE|nr:hypothetical protein JZ751_016647 [Albula glossodonta]